MCGAAATHPSKGPLAPRSPPLGGRSHPCGAELLAGKAQPGDGVNRDRKGMREGRPPPGGGPKGREGGRGSAKGGGGRFGST